MWYAEIKIYFFLIFEEKNRVLFFENSWPFSFGDHNINCAYSAQNWGRTTKKSIHAQAILQQIRVI